MACGSTTIESPGWITVIWDCAAGSGSANLPPVNSLSFCGGSTSEPRLTGSGAESVPRRGTYSSPYR